MVNVSAWLAPSRHCPRWSIDISPGGKTIMGADRAVNLLNDMLWNGLIIAAPILMATLVVGILISVFQVATQIQEITLSYVPKILTAALLLIALGPWMIARLVDFSRGLYLTIPTLAG